MARTAHKDELNPYPLGLDAAARARFDRLMGRATYSSESARPGTSTPHPTPDRDTAPKCLPEPSTDELKESHRKALIEDLHISTTLGMTLLTQVLHDQDRMQKYGAMIEHLLEGNPLRDVERIRKLELMLEIAHRSWLRGLEAIRLHRAPASPVLIQAAAAAGGHVHVQVSAPRRSGRKPGRQSVDS